MTKAKTNESDVSLPATVLCEVTEQQHGEKRGSDGVPVKMGSGLFNLVFYYFSRPS